MSTVTANGYPHPDSARACPSRLHRDLRSRQAWTLDHIIRCSCGAWVVVPDEVLQAIAAGTFAFPIICPHFRAAAS